MWAVQKGSITALYRSHSHAFSYDLYAWVHRKTGTHTCHCHPHKIKRKLLNYMEPLICERADGLKGNVCCPNVLHGVVLDLIRFTSAYWHITGLCHLRSLTEDGDSLVCYGSRSHLTNAVAQPSITLIHFQCAGLLEHSSHRRYVITPVTLAEE